MRWPPGDHRISAVSGLFEFIREAAAGSKLPILIHNPAHKDFVKRPSTDPIDETVALSARNARKLMELPPADGDILHYRDRAILKFYLFTGSRIRTGCLLDVADFHFEEDDPTVKVQEKGRGKSKRTIGIHVEAAEAIREYVAHAGLTSGPLFRARPNSRSRKLGVRRIRLSAMYRRNRQLKPIFP
ncbi:MAG: tyrosine-type recombinase/integrase [Candidatus Eisenbacteria bacterium]|nr:tyrosine-type recombinase/integrase [Candidatus Eisenbacteria bacterium]